MIEKLIRKYTLFESKESFSYKMRKKRMKVFTGFFEECLKESLEKQETNISILDVGGELWFWKMMDFKYSDMVNITLLNINPRKIPKEYTAHFFSVEGDATNMEMFADKQFDFVFSNSVIEHVGKKKEWEMMASEMKRVASHGYLQTPNKLFPIEPHFAFPFFQFFPKVLKIKMLQNKDMGSYKATGDYNEAKKIADEVHLLTYSDLRRLFPNDKIIRERLLLFTKSFMCMW